MPKTRKKTYLDKKSRTSVMQDRPDVVLLDVLAPTTDTAILAKPAGVVVGRDNGGGAGVFGFSDCEGGSGVQGEATANKGYGVRGIAEQSGDGAVCGVSGEVNAGRGDGVYGYGHISSGVHGHSTLGTGVIGYSRDGTGVYGGSTNGTAAYFNGRLWVSGDAHFDGEVRADSLQTYGLSTGNGVAYACDLVVDGHNANAGAVNPGLTFGSHDSGEGVSSKRTRYGNQNGLDFHTASTTRMSITNGGYVGIGTTAPSEILEVDGNVKVTGTIALEDTSNLKDWIAQVNSRLSALESQTTQMTSDIAALQQMDKTLNSGITNVVHMVGALTLRVQTLENKC